MHQLTLSSCCHPWLGEGYLRVQLHLYTMAPAITFPSAALPRLHQLLGNLVCTYSTG